MIGLPSSKTCSTGSYDIAPKAFLIIAAAATIATSFHFWPFETSAIWQILSIPNLACAFAILWLSALCLLKHTRRRALSYIPHTCILVYIIINILGIAFAEDLSRSLNFTIKLVLAFLGGWLLFKMAITGPKSLRLIYSFVVIAAGVAVASCLFTRLVISPQRFGFFDSSLKYGTYIGIFVPLSCIYLICRSNKHFIPALLLASAGIISANSVGAWLAILAGLLAPMAIAARHCCHWKILTCIVISIAALAVSNYIFAGRVRGEFALSETDNLNVRQRYIEWQSFINISERKGIVGTGPGCINYHRSAFYHRLPKLNTIKPFDQNGFLAVLAETGMLGLVSWLWIWIHFGKISLTQSRALAKTPSPPNRAMVLANSAALAGAIIANAFSALHYNGILIIFVILIVLISSTHTFLKEDGNEN